MGFGNRVKSREMSPDVRPARKETATMPGVPAKQTGAAEPVETVEEKFRRLASVWRAETAYVSSSSDLVAHPAFREIVGMGAAVIPLLLRELEHRTGHWHRALRLITGADPVPPADRGNLDKAVEAWLRWGREQGYEW
jgi:hypothetical protein